MSARIHRSLIVILAALCGACGGGGGGGDDAQLSNAPSAVIVVESTRGHAPFTVFFESTGSSAPPGVTMSYTWEFGDGTSGKTQNATHTYESLGIFSAQLIVTGSNGEQDTASVAITVHEQAAGYYLGYIDSDATGQQTDIEALVGANGEIYAWDLNFDSLYWGDYNISERMLTGTVIAELFNDNMTFVDGTQRGTVAISMTATAKTSLYGPYSGTGDTGFISLSYFEPLSENPMTLAQVAGTWEWSDGAGLIESLIIEESGALSYQSTSGCTASGNLKHTREDLNGYQFDMDLQCPAGVNNNPNGIRSGVAFIDDYFYTEEWIVFHGSIGNEGTFLAFARPHSAPTSQQSSFKPSTAQSVDGRMRGVWKAR